MTFIKAELDRDDGRVDLVVVLLVIGGVEFHVVDEAAVVPVPVSYTHLDSDYRGAIQVGLVNLSDEPCTLEPGERVAQLMVMPVARCAFTFAEKLDETQRGEGGFGSTGRL